jgi:hypothetical protein
MGLTVIDLDPIARYPRLVPRGTRPSKIHFPRHNEKTVAKDFTTITGLRDNK